MILGWWRCSRSLKGGPAGNRFTGAVDEESDIGLRYRLLFVRGRRRAFCWQMCASCRLLDVLVDDGCSISPRHFNFEQIHLNWEYVMGLEMEMKLEREKE